MNDYHFPTYPVYDVKILNKRTDSPTESTIYVGRPSPWGNPFKVGSQYRQGEAVIEFARWLAEHPDARWMRENVHTLAGHDLMCWCSPKHCHAGVLALAAAAKAEGLLAKPLLLDFANELVVDSWAD